MTPIKLLPLPHGRDLPLPAKQTALAAGFDLYAAVDGEVTLARGAIRLVPAGFAVEIPAGFELQVRARSGLSTRHGVTLANGIGTIDADYRGEVKVPLINLGPADFVIRRGERIAQMVLVKLPDAQIVEVESLGETNRAAGGFGSTG